MQSFDIKTFAFFDLETTGLPDLEFFKTKITELSIVACPVAQLLDPEMEVPRVQHKLTLCFNPFKMISLKATEVTGLTNEMLEYENKLDRNTMDLLESFLLQLQQPVCLISHNGNKFDFPLLKKQHDILNGSFPIDLKCCDSLHIFRAIDEMNDKKIELLKEPYSIQGWDDVKDVGTIINADDEILLESSSFTKEEHEDELIAKASKPVNIEILEELIQKPMTNGEKPSIPSFQVLNETTPDKPSKPAIHQPFQTPILDTVTRPRTSTKRELFPSTPSPAAKKKTRKSFTLGEIYKRFFGSYPMNAHDSESDCLSLLKCASACKLDFVKIVNDTCVNFSDIKRF